METLDDAGAEVAAALAAAGYRTDFSPASLAEVDRFFDEQDCEGALAGDTGAKITMIGVYVGEVLRRAVGGCWVEGGEEPVLELASGETTSPILRTAMRRQSARASLADYGAAHGLAVQTADLAVVTDSTVIQ